VFGFAIFAAAAAAAPVQLSDIHAQLYYMGTGRLSEDVLNRPKEFVLWNTIIGEGDADENADDILITVQLIGDKFGKPEDNEQVLDDPVVITARNEKGKLVASRTFKHVLLSTRGSAWLSLWLPEQTCESVDVQATYQKQRKVAHLKMACGE
jgi:hypothetical protein